MKIHALSFAFIMFLPDVIGTDPETHGICSLDRDLWSRTWNITMTKVNDDGEIRGKLWANLREGK